MQVVTGFNPLYIHDPGPRLYFTHCITLQIHIQHFMCLSTQAYSMIAVWKIQKGKKKAYLMMWHICCKKDLLWAWMTLGSPVIGTCLGAAATWPSAAGDHERAQSHCHLYQNQEWRQRVRHCQLWWCLHHLGHSVSSPSAYPDPHTYNMYPL